MSKYDTIRDLGTRELVSLHNVMTMGRGCLQVGDTRHSARCLAVADSELRKRGVPAPDGRLIKERG